MTIKAKTFTGGGGGAGTDTLDDVTGRGATTTNAITVGGLSVGTAYTLPTSDGSTGEFLKTDGSGNISFGGVTGGLTYKGSYNATTSTPSLVTALKGDFYIVSVAGSLAGVSLAVGDHIVFNQNAANPVTSAMFDVIDNTEADTLDSVTTRGSTTSNTVDVGGLTINSAITFPTADGGANQFLKTSGSGTLSFDTALTAVVDDATPELASDLDTVGNGITSSVGGFSLTTSGGSDITIGADLVPVTNNTNNLGSEDKRYITTFSDLNGAVRFKAKNDSGGVISKGQAVYITGISGDVPTVDLARSNSASTMPAFGLAASNANDQAEVQVVSFGNLTAYNTTTYSLSVGDTVYVSSSTAGALTNTAPTGESNLIQNIGKVVRASATEGIIKVGGAGRSAATPNLDQDKIFLGDASNQAVSTALSSINLSSFNNDLSSVYQPLDAGLTSISGLTTAADKMIYTTASDVYAVADLTTAGRALLDDADAAAQRTTLGLGTASTQDVGTTANDVVQLDGSARLPAVDGSQLTNLPSASDASETTKGIIEIATNAEATAATATDKALVPSNISSIALSSFNNDLSFQPLDAGLTSISGLTTAADKLIYTTASDTYAVASLTSYGRTLVSTNDAGAARSALGLGTAATQDVGTTANDVVQLDGSSRLPAVDGSQLTNLPTASDASETTKGIIEIATNAEATAATATDKALVPSNISSIALSSFNDDLSYQPLDAGLTSISGLTTAADKMIYTTASDTYAVADLTTAGRALLDDADAAAQRTTLGLGTAATSASTDFLASTAAINDLSDVTITAAAAGEYLRYSGSAWVDASLSVVDDTTPQLGGDLDLNGNDLVTTGNANIGLAPNGTGYVEIKGNTNPGAIRLNCESNSHGVQIQSPAHSASATYNLILPTGVGTSGQVLKTDGGDGGSPNTVQLAWVDQASGGGGWTYSAITADPANAQVGYHYSCTSGSFTITLPAASGASAGSEIRVKNMGTGTITIDPGTDTIDGSTTDYTMDVQYSAITLVSNGSNGWEII
ncbi:MAG: putative fiber protein [Prokaryotic dsDNA virus sp.]|nr:MAG: putative fiber protein [Prokaryotic dsDNA virus sp.]|tara:strand:+ start:2726 stop:5815 length:3090 start_codon:yes stop_codon:yes gene_type:complete